MNNVIAYLWKGKNTQTKALNSESMQEPRSPGSPLPPCVTASHSVETTESPTRSPRKRYIRVGLPNVPTTPEGLRPRPNLAAIRSELNIRDNNKRINAPNTDSIFASLPPQPVPSMTSASWPGIQQATSSSSMTYGSYTYASKQSCPFVASSPRLLPGQALTAVGALLATQFVPSQETVREDYRDEDERKVSMYEDAEGNEDDAKEVSFSYQPLDVSQDLTQTHTPGRSAPFYTDNSPNRKGYISPPISPHSSIAASPSSLAPYMCANDESALNTSFQSRTRLLPPPPILCNKGSPYDLAPLGASGVQEGTEVVWEPSDQDTFLSGMSQSQHHLNSSNTQSDDSVGESLVNRKQHNQKQQRHDLLFQVIERLQDNLSLINNVDKTQASILTGFDKQSRACIVRHMSIILNEMDVANQEEFFMSPTNMQKYSQPNNELKDALLLCMSLIHLADLPSGDDSSNTKCWYLSVDAQIALGLSNDRFGSPQTRRGGDTSVFTLPSESNATPMASNVSVSSTITSFKTYAKVDSRALRKVINEVTVVLDQISSACRILAQSQDTTKLNVAISVKTMSQIKDAYKQLCSIPIESLTLLVDTFVFQQPLAVPVESARDAVVPALSSDPDGSSVKASEPVPVPVPVPVQEQAHSSSSSVPSRSDRVAARARQLRLDTFSPCTWDMRTSHGEDEDLRRQIGSIDHEQDFTELRE